MLNYLRRLLEPPDLADIIWVSAVVIIAAGVTVVIDAVAGMFALLIATVVLGLCLGPVLGSWWAGLFVAACAEMVVVAVSLSAARATTDDRTWPIVSTVAMVLAIAVFHERMK